MYFRNLIEFLELFKPIRKRKRFKPALGRPLAQVHRPNGTVARLDLPAIRPCGPGQADQLRPKLCGPSATGRAPPVVTTRWPRTQRRGGVADAGGAGAQPRRGVAVANQ
jgi:hypothetical protein